MYSKILSQLKVHKKNLLNYIMQSRNKIKDSKAAARVKSNEQIIENFKKLDRLARINKDTYRERAFKRAISVIRSLKFPIKDPKQLQDVPGIGKGILERIDEILKRGKLKELEQTSNKEEVMDKFLKIFGVGVKKAERWYDQGLRDLKDVEKKANLTPAQEIGLRYYDELNEPVPRQVIDKISNNINKALKGTGVSCVMAGSYRRGEPFSEEIDCLLYSDSGKSLHSQEKSTVIKKLEEIKLITDELSRGSNRFMGICKDPQGKHRRINFEFVKDGNSYPYELLYFTGSEQFNLEMRQAAKEKGMLLNQYGLYKSDMLIQAKDEKEIFKHLGMNYIAPEDR